ncbi:MAG: PAS domain S-box protein [Flavobacteriales bacterium]
MPTIPDHHDSGVEPSGPTNREGELEALVRQFHSGNEHYRAIVESSEDGIISKDLNGIITSWNEGAEHIFGYTAAEMIGTPVRRLLPPELQEQEDSILARIRQGERVHHFETERMHRNGTRIPVSLNISPIKDREGRIFGASKIVRDITAQKQAALLRNRLSAIVESSDDAIISKDLKGIIQSWNQGAERILGYTAEEMVGTSILRIVPQHLLGEEADIIQRIRAGTRIDHFRTSRVRKDGTEIPLSITVSPVRDDHGIVIGASKVARDFSEQLEVEQQLANAALLKDRFMATLAHELRNPLAALTTAWELMDLAKDDPDMMENAHAMMGRQLRQLTRLVNDLMDISRVNNGKLTMCMEELSLHHILHAAVEQAQPAIQDAGDEVHLETAPAHIRIHGDEVRLIQLFGNLLSNAVKFSPAGSPITIRTRLQGDRVAIVVEDKGIGIPKEHLDKVFEMFAQLTTTRGDRRSGLGIGLNLVRQLVALHGGTISVVSAGQDKGSSFTVQLPVVQPAG